MSPFVWACVLAFQVDAPPPAAPFPRFETQEIDPKVGNVCYALTIADVNDDRRPDVVAVTEDAVVWYENPSWTRRDILRGKTERDNVCIQGRDLDGDGRVDFVLGAGWRPPDTQGGGTLYYLSRGIGGNEWSLRNLGAEPSLHRLRFGNTNGGDRPQLIVAPLQGRGTKAPNWNEGAGSRILVYTIPADPMRQDWVMEVADESLHTIHNLHVLDFDRDGRDEILLGAWEGVFVLDKTPSGAWTRTRLGTGNQETRPFKGSSEIKLGALGGGLACIATIEPWHGHQVVVYTPPTNGTGLWDRLVVDQPVSWGHAVWWANLDGDADQELIVGQRDRTKPEELRGTNPPREAGPGVIVYDPTPRAGAEPLRFTRHAIDDGGVAVEDLVAEDLNGDGRVDLIAGGRSTHNVRIYWNRGQ